MCPDRLCPGLLGLLVIAAVCIFLTSCASFDTDTLTDNTWPGRWADFDKPHDVEPKSDSPDPGSAFIVEEASPIVPPSAPLELTVEEAILLALENNQLLRVERLEPAIRRTYEQQELAEFDSRLRARFSGSRERAEQENASTSDTTSSETGASVGVSKSLTTGTDVSIDLTTDRRWSDLYSDQHATRLGLTVTQALLKGAGLDVNLASVRQARLGTLASEYELRGFTEALLAAVETTYWDYALAHRQIEIFEDSLRLAEQQLRETQERINVGKLPETELAAAQAEVALRREALINTRSNLASIRLQLLRLTNPRGPDIWDREVVLRDQPAAPDVKLDDVQAHVAVALRMRPDLNEARLGIERGDLEIVTTKNGMLPKMDLFITLGKSGYADSFSRSVRELDGKSYDIAAGVSLEYPFANRDARARHQRALHSHRQAAEAVENLAQLVQVDVRSGYIEVERTMEQVAATAATRKLQEEKLRAENMKFRVGKSTTLLVAQAQRDLVASQISEIQAVVNYLNALVELFRLEGSLLERRGISAPGRLPTAPPLQHDQADGG